MEALSKINIIPPDQYDFWRRRMAGEVVPIHDGEPQAGQAGRWWRFRNVE